jgi:DNA-binding SARP family transcriptional activator/Tfp pilus assembly protein PilF
MMPVTEIRVLGPLALVVAGQELAVASTRQRRLLAMLALHAGRAVSVATLVDAIWDDDPPITADATLQSHASRLRHLLGDKPLSRTPNGYRLDIDPQAVDAMRFEELVTAARSDVGPERALGLLDEALALWRGDAYPDLAHHELGVAATVRLRELHTIAKEARAEALLAVDRAEDAVADLEALTLRQPLRERPWQLLMRAQLHCGRQADALAAFGRYATWLAEEGLEPSESTKRLREAILVAPETVRREPSAAPAAVAGTPAQLPATVAAFTGRAAELARLDALLGESRRTPTAVLITTIGGTAGIGKTTLAVHWAHRVADRFPDGQLYVNLRGFDPSGTAMTPGEAVRGFLDALGVPVERIPATTDAQAALYRSLVAGRRMLVLLDNAATAEQVRPLLPGSATCLVLVTSRDQLTALVAVDGARPVVLDRPSAEDAARLLVARLGRARTAAEPGAVTEIVELCARLPLALAVVASRAAVNPALPLGALAGELLADRDRLAALDAGETTAQVRAVFSWSYQRLSPAAATLFRLLGLHPGPDIGVPAVASLSGVPPGEVRPVLAELARANLVAEHRPGRYDLHDLLRVYAAELAETVDPPAERDAARGRLLDHYLHTARAADELLHPNRERPVLSAPAAGVRPQPLADREAALAWFNTESPVFGGLIDEALRCGLDGRGSQLSRMINQYLYYQGDWNQMVATQTAALAAARRMGDRWSEAFSLRTLALVYVRMGALDEALTHSEQALVLCAADGDQTALAHTHYRIANLQERMGHLDEALGHAYQALEIYQAIGHARGQARSFNTVGWFLAQLGQYEKAIGYCEQGLAASRELGEVATEAATWDSLGYCHQHLGRHAQAEECFLTALDRYREIGDRYGESEVLANLGEYHRQAGRHDSARESWKRAWDILRELGHPDAERVRAKLRGLD